jgi:hypothetical protein
MVAGDPEMLATYAAELDRLRDQHEELPAATTETASKVLSTFNPMGGAIAAWAAARKKAAQ